VLVETKSPETRSFVSRILLRNGRLYTPTPETYREAEELIISVDRLGIGVHIEMPEALCLVFAKKRLAVVLSENLGAYAVPHLIDNFSEVKVWRSIEVIYEAARREVLKVYDEKSFIEEIKIFERETGHLIRRKEVVKYAEKLFPRRT